MDTAMAALCSSALRTGSVARTAAAPQTDAPDAVSMAVSRSRPKILFPSQVPRMNVEASMISETMKPSIPTSAICWKVMRKP